VAYINDEIYYSPEPSIKKEINIIIAAIDTPIVGYKKTPTALGLPRSSNVYLFIVNKTGKNETIESMIPTIIATT